MEKVMDFGSTFKGKRILITGNTGFKGSWLTIWLKLLGADVYGYSDGVISTPSMFESLELNTICSTEFGDVTDDGPFFNFVDKIQPDIVFHLAAQAIVGTSYSDPKKTFMSNVMGTVSVLEMLRLSKRKIITVMITSDKVYENNEWVWGYRETDILGGKDPYSASKSAAELAIASYISSFFNNHNSRLVIGRAGNVIGGGDWSFGRIVPDVYRSVESQKPLLLRSPNATRPWQHVLEPISGYLLLAKNLLEDNSDINHEAFNFGPHSNQNQRVQTLIEDIQEKWPKFSFLIEKSTGFHEAGLLKLDCDKAKESLDWTPTLNFDQTVEFTSSWYKNYFDGEVDMFQYTNEQIKQYTLLMKMSDPLLGIK